MVDVDADGVAEDEPAGGGIGLRRPGLGKGKTGLGRVLVRMGWGAGGREGWWGD